MNLLDNNFDYTYTITNRYDIPNPFIEVYNKKIKIELLVHLNTFEHHLN